MALLTVGQLGAAFRPLPGSLEERVRLLAGLHQGVVLVATGGGDREFLALNRLVRLGLAPGVRLHACDAPPTVLALVSSVMQSGRFGPGDVLEVLSAVRAVVTTVSVIGSVSALDRPRPTLRQHARSLLPGGRFVVDVTGGGVHSGAGALNRVQRMHGACMVLASADDPASRGWREQLRGLAPQAPTLDLDTPAPHAVAWRSARWAEATSLAVPVQEFAVRLDGYLARQQCRSCGRPVAGTNCPLCGVVCAAPAPVPTPASIARVGHGPAAVTQGPFESDPDATPALGIAFSRTGTGS